MTTHEAEVAAVLDEVLRYGSQGYWGQQREQVLAALSAAGIACVYVPDETIDHGARLVRRVTYDDGRTLYAIEATS